MRTMWHEESANPEIEHFSHIAFEQAALLERCQYLALCQYVHVLLKHQSSVSPDNQSS